MSEAEHGEIRPWHVERSEPLQDCRIFTLKRELSHSPDGQKSGQFYVLDAPDWVGVVPVTTDGHVVCVVQYRHGSRRVALETPAGLVNPGEPVEAAAARELREETGFSAASFTILGRTYANSAFMTNHFTAVLAEGVTLTDPTAWDEHEEIQVKLIPVDQVPRLLADGQIENTSSNLALSWYLLHRQGILPLG